MSPAGRTCANCGESIEGRSARAKFCGVACKRARYKRDRSRSARKGREVEPAPVRAEPCSCESPIYAFDLGRYCVKCGRKAPLPPEAVL